MKIFSVDGKIVELLKPDEVYLAMWKKNGFWTVSGVLYRNADEIPSNLALLYPDAILVIKLKVPMKDLND